MWYILGIIEILNIVVTYSICNTNFSDIHCGNDNSTIMSCKYKCFMLQILQFFYEVFIITESNILWIDCTLASLERHLWQLFSSYVFTRKCLECVLRLENPVCLSPVVDVCRRNFQVTYMQLPHRGKLSTTLTAVRGWIIHKSSCVRENVFPRSDVSVFCTKNQTGQRCALRSSCCGKITQIKRQKKYGKRNSK